MRSRRWCAGHPDHRQGIISACAEQTSTGCPSSPAPRDHLRVCGADGMVLPPIGCHMGSSPRVRSRHTGGRAQRHVLGIISACAEQTERSPRQQPCRWDHLRVCGADQLAKRSSRRKVGSSPRVRSRQTLRRRHPHRRRIISACAEQTRRRTRSCLSRRDHLRVCGADTHLSD